jgi:hypothetical protein
MFPRNWQISRNLNYSNLSKFCGDEGEILFELGNWGRGLVLGFLRNDLLAKIFLNFYFSLHLYLARSIERKPNDLQICKAGAWAGAARSRCMPERQIYCIIFKFALYMPKDGCLSCSPMRFPCRSRIMIQHSLRTSLNFTRHLFVRI